MPNTTNVNVADNCDPNPTVKQSKPVGSLLALGNTTVNITATDKSNNTVYVKSHILSYFTRLLVVL